MSAEVKTAAAPQQAAPEKAKKPSIVDTFLKGCAKGFKVGIENITPAMILGYVLVYILQETGLMDLLGTVMSPVMGSDLRVLCQGVRLRDCGVHVSGRYADARPGLDDAARLYPDGHADRPLCAYRTGYRIEQKVAPAAHRHLSAGCGDQPGHYAHYPGDDGRTVSQLKGVPAYAIQIVPAAWLAAGGLWQYPDRHGHAG